MIIKDFFRAFTAGHELANAVTWKNRQVLVAQLTILGSAVLGILSVFGYRIDLNAEDITLLASAVGVLVGLFNGTAMVVSTTRIGLPSRPDHGSEARSDDSPTDPRNLGEAYAGSDSNDADVFGTGYRG